METIHLIESSTRHNLLKQFLKQTPVLFNHRFESFDQLFYQNPPQPNRLFQSRKVINQHRESFKLLSEVLDYDESLQQALSFLDLLDCYQLPLDTLPMDSELHQEKTNLIKLLASHIERPYQYPKSIDAEIIVHPFYQELYHQPFLNHAKRITPKPTKPQILAYKALNIHQEVREMIALLNQKQPKSCLILVGDNTYLHELQRQEADLFCDLSYLHQSSPSLTHLSFYYLIEAFVNQDIDALIKWLDINPFKFENSAALIDAITIYQLDFNTLKNNFIQLDQVELSLFQNASVQMKQYRLALHAYQQLQPLFEKIDTHHFLETINTCYMLYARNLSSSQLQSLQSTLESVLPLLTSENVLDLLKDVLSRTIKETPILSDYLVCESRFQPIDHVEICIFLGMTQKNYPNFKSMTGLYGESYVEKVVGFPKLVDRIAFHQQQMESFLTCSDELIIFTSMIDYQGNALETPFEIDDLLKQQNLSFELCQMPTTQGSDNHIGSLSSKLAMELFFDQQQLHGSISSFEVFFKNSYHYFIERGLKVQDKQLIDLDVALVGTITHDVFENLIKKYEKDYVNHPESIGEYLQPYYFKLIHLYPHKQAFYQLAFIRLKESIALTLHRLRHFEMVSDLVPSKDFLEYNYENFQLFKELPVYLLGFIDRIDQNHSTYAIFDYKSSQKQLELKKLLNGQQLQLITYALVFKDLFHKVCRGVYYINFQEPYEKINRYDFAVSTGLKIIEPADRRPLSGFTFNLDVDSPFVEMVNGLKVKSNQQLNNLYDLAYFEREFRYLYRTLLNHLSAGHILRNKIEDTYFYYKDHERVKNWFNFDDSIQVEIEMTLKQEVEEEIDDEHTI